MKEYILDYHRNALPKLIARDLAIGETNKIVSIIGPRRAGKTYFLYQKIGELLSQGVKKENTLYLNFEDPRLMDLTYKDFGDIIKIHWQLYPGTIKEKLFILIDEPQNIIKWEAGVRYLHDNNFKVFLTGSSSKLLSKEIATGLRGRSLSYLLLPFSFGEFLKLKEKTFDINKLGSRDRALLLSLLDEYISFGGFPEVIIEESPESKIRIIKEYFDLIVYKDIAERYKIKNSALVKWLIKISALSMSREFSINKAFLNLKSKGIKVSKNTLYAYASMLEEALFIFPVEPFNYSARKKDFTINKVYLCDIGFSKLVESTSNTGNKAENIAFLELKRREKPLTSISYYKNAQGYEVDFVIKEGTGIKQLIQVCCGPTNKETNEREIRALLHASKELKCKNLLIITQSQESNEEAEWFGIKGKIKYVPLWKWLLER